MKRDKRPAGKRKPPRPSEAAFTAVCNLLIAGKTPEENRLAVRHLLRQASRDLERNR